MRQPARPAPSLLVLLLLAMTVPAVAQVSRSAPDPYEEMAKLLTPLAEAREIDTEQWSEDEAGGVLLVRERIDSLSGSGSRLFVHHSICKPITDAGVKATTRLVFGINRELQRVHLPVARTIAPDGTIFEVAAEAVFLQTPQHQAEEGIYTGTEELVVIFPNVKPGHLVEHVVVVEQISPRIPGEYGAIVKPNAYWPTARFQRVVELPEEMADRLRVVPVGGPVPDLSRQDLGHGRLRLRWQAEEVPRLRWEPGREPTRQGGPAVWLTTMASWDVLAAWYSGLLAERDRLGPQLEELVDQWTGHLDDPRQVLQVLYRKVADDIRYVGLELGIGALQPRPPADVWTSQYGDCKDKANLLRVMLQQRGISSYLTLVDTEHAGRFETAVPDRRHFNHAILAVDLGDDGYLFCDPTVPRLRLGLLPPHDSGRPVLVVRGDRHDLQTIPPAGAGTIRFAFDLQLAADGELRGWLQIDATDYYAAVYAEHYQHRIEQVQRSNLLSLIDSFFPGAELIDIELGRGQRGESEESEGNEDGSEDRFAARAYFVVAGSHQEGARHLSCPHGGVVYPYLGDTRERQTRFYQRLETTALVLRYRLPSGWATTGPPPQSLRLRSPALEVDACWQVEDNVVEAGITYTAVADLIEPVDYPSFSTAITSLSSWMSTPLAVRAQGSQPHRPPSGGGDIEIELPLLPSGGGQLRLVDRLYPEDSDPARRRAALGRVLQYFPDDVSTVFDTEIKLALLDSDEGHSEEARQRIERALTTHGDTVDRESVAWGKYLLGTMLWELEQQEQALAIMRELLAQDSLSAFRRGLASLSAASILFDSQPQEALRLLLEGIALESEVTSDLFSLLLRLCLHQDDLALAGEQLAGLAEHNPELAETTFAGLLKMAVELNEEGETVAAAEVAELLEQVRQDSAVGVPSEQLERLQELAAGARAYDTITADIRRSLSTSPPDWWQEADPGVDTFADLVSAMERFDADGEYRSYLRCGLQLLADHHHELADFGHLLWLLAGTAERNEPQMPLFETLLDWCLQLPEHDQYYLESLFLHGRRLERQDRQGEAAALYRQQADRADMTPTYRVAFLYSLGRLRQEQGLADEALAAYRQLEGDRHSNRRGADGLLRAVFLHLEGGDFDEALRLIGLLAEVGEETLPRCESSEQIKRLVELAEDESTLRRFWSAQRDWWPSWQALEEALEIAPRAGVEPPLIPDQQAFGVELGKAVGGEARDEFFVKYRRMVHAARWQPEHVPEVISVARHAISLAPELGEQIRTFILAISSGLTPDYEPLYKRSRLILVQLLISWDEEKEAITIAHDYLQHFATDDPVGQGVVRLWGLAASLSGHDLEPAIEHFEQILAADKHLEQRTITVHILSQLYQRAGRRNQEVELLRREVIGREGDNDAYHQRLVNRYHGLVERSERIAGFTAAVTDWAERFLPPWFAFARPHRLDDPAITDLEHLVTDGGGGFSELETTKLRLLVALAAEQEQELRELAFAMAVASLADQGPRRQPQRTMLEAVVHDDRFGDSTRSYALWILLRDDFNHHDREAMGELMTGEPFTAWKDEKRQEMTRLRDGLITLDDPRELVERRLQELLQQESLDGESLLLLSMYLGRLGQLGAFDTVEAAIEQLGSVSLDSEVDQSSAAIRLGHKRRLRAVRKAFAVFDEVRSLVLDRNPPQEITRPEVWDDLADPDSIGHLPRETALQVLLYRLKVRDVPGDLIGFAGDLTIMLRDLRQQADLNGQLFGKVLAAADDEKRSYYIYLLADSCFDIDDDGERRQRTLHLAPYRDPTASPMSYTAIRLVELRTILRTGGALETETCFDGLPEHPALSWDRPSLVITAHQLRGRTEALRRALEAIPADRLLDPDRVALYLPALRQAGMTEEAELLVEVAEQELYESVLGSWATLEASAIGTVLELSRLLSGEPRYPQEWRDFLLQQVGDENRRANLLLSDAELRQDWTTVAEAAGELVDRLPRAYDLYWHLGRACTELGRKEQAIAALTTFTRYCHDSLHHRQAVALLQTLRGGNGGVPAQ